MAKLQLWQDSRVRSIVSILVGLLVLATRKYTMRDWNTALQITGTLLAMYMTTTILDIVARPVPIA